jgi:hypothetical protein
LLPSVPVSSDDVGGLYSCGASLLEKFYTLYYRLLADLTLIAEKVGNYFGLDPLAAVSELEDK